MFGLFNCGGASTVRQGRTVGALACITARSFSEACSRRDGTRRFVAGSRVSSRIGQRNRAVERRRGWGSSRVLIDR
jgi:hypothetical protein